MPLQSKKLRVLLVSPYYPPGVGGACRLLEMLTMGLAQRGHIVEILGLGEPFYSGCADFDSRQSYKIHRVKAQDHRSTEVLRMAFKLIQIATTRKYDAIVCWTAWSSGVIALFTKLFLGVPFIIYTHGEDTTTVKGYRYKELLVRAAYQLSSDAFANSKFSQEAAFEIASHNIRCNVLQPTINSSLMLNVTETEMADIRNRIGVGDSKFILTIARLDPRKGQDTVIRSLPKLKSKVDGLKYVVIGKGDKDRLKKIAIEIGVADDVLFVDYLSDSELAAIYTASTVYVMVSRWDSDSQEVEGFGMTYLEAAAAGKPSVAGNQGGAIEAVVDGVTGLVVNPESVDETTEAIARIISDDSLARRMGTAARKRVLAEYSTTNFVSTFEDSLLSLKK